MTYPSPYVRGWSVKFGNLRVIWNVSLLVEWNSTELGGIWFDDLTVLMNSMETCVI